MGKEFADICTAREQRYLFLARLFREEPGEEFLRGLADVEDSLDGPMGAYARSLESRDIERERMDAAADYARCFLGMSEDPVSPFESVWRSPLRLMMQEPRDEVVAAYSALGMVRDASVKIPEDHVAFELEFMALLCARSREAFENGAVESLGSLEALQKKFYGEHLDSWAGDMCDKLARRCRTEYLRAIALELKVALEDERAYLFSNS